MQQTTASMPAETGKRLRLDKSLLTNLLAAALILAGGASPLYPETLQTIGIFALSGGITNWLAVHMLFERVPLLYGSGVIPAHFEGFKRAIRQLIMTQFFTPENIQRFIQKEEHSSKQLLDMEPILERIDYDKLFQSLVSAIAESSFGSLLNMVGGPEALEPLKDPFNQKIRAALTRMTESPVFAEALHEGLNEGQFGRDLIDSVEQIVQKRLDELTPELVKDIVQQIIRDHLGWLVVWGGVFGGAIGWLYCVLPALR